MTPKVTCRRCGKTFVHNRMKKYCDECAYERRLEGNRERARRASAEREPATKICPSCNKEFTHKYPRTKYCKDCREGEMSWNMIRYNLYKSIRHHLRRLVGDDIRKAVEVRDMMVVEDGEEFAREVVGEDLWHKIDGEANEED